MANQKHIVILLVITASLASFLGGYLLTQPHNPSSTLEDQRGVLIDRFNGVDSASTPTPLPPGLYQASPDAALSPVTSNTGDAVVYYHPDTGAVSSVDLETRKATIISTASLPKLVRVIWSPDRNRVITVSRGTTTQTYAYFDYTTHTHGSLGNSIKDAVFSPDSRQIAVVRNQGGDSLIQVANFDGTNPQTILQTRLDGVQLAWPAQSMLAFSAADASSNSRSLYSLSLTGDLSQLVGGVSGLTARWSPNGSSLLYSDLDSGPELQFLTLANNQTQILGVAATADNCDWITSTSVICAVQTEGETSVLQISPADQSKTVLFSHLIITPQQAFLSPSNKFFVLISSDQSVWAVKLAD
jgi:hypothetical protein